MRGSSWQQRLRPLVALDIGRAKSAEAPAEIRDRPPRTIGALLSPIGRQVLSRPGLAGRPAGRSISSTRPSFPASTPAISNLQNVSERKSYKRYFYNYILACMVSYPERMPCSSRLSRHKHRLSPACTRGGDAPKRRRTRSARTAGGSTRPERRGPARRGLPAASKEPCQEEAKSESSREV